MSFEIALNGEVVKADTSDAAMRAMEDLHKKHGGIPTCREVIVNPTPVAAGQIDTAAAKRIDTMQEKLKASGVFDAKSIGHTVAAADGTQTRGPQFYANGTRMQAGGYDTQRARELEFRSAEPIRDVAATLVAKVQAEKRRDVEISAGTLASAIQITNGRITADGYALSEMAIRGMMPRIKSGALAYLLSMRDRSAQGDREMIVDALRHELSTAGNIGLKLRVRDGIGDCFAVVSPSYSVADAPEALKQITDALPKDAKGTYSYDPTSTAWQLRAKVWTPTPVAEQAVGEPFEGYAALGGRDGGNGSVYGQGGVLVLRCLNASTYAAETAVSRRVHRGSVLIDVAALFKNATKAIDVLCDVWGKARTVEMPSTPTVEGVKLSREIALAGYFRDMLSNKRSELMGVLPGRTAEHIEKLVPLYASERRDAKKLVKSDMGQALTRYVQGFSVPVQRDAESAVSEWLASDRSVVCDVRDGELQ